MTPHPQADILRAIADGKTIEMRRKNTSDTDNDWWVSNIVLQYLDDADREFRIKPETLLINNIEVPYPVREPLKPHQNYWVAGPDRECIAERFKWADDPIENHWFKRGLIHSTEEAAIAHAEALLSFTRSDKLPVELLSLARSDK